jgi:hypothetical protein
MHVFGGCVAAVVACLLACLLADDGDVNMPMFKCCLG